QPGLLANRLYELVRPVRLQRAGRIVEKDAGRTEVWKLACLLDEHVRLPCVAGAVDEPGVELTAGRGDRLGCLTQVRDVVQRVVQTEDLDAVLGRRRDETAHEIGPDGPRADEKATAQRQSQRRLRPGLERADPLPGALHSAPHGAVEHAAPRNLQACEA